ncbi:hypothetical protein ACP70R_034524 [Stipagrostis hirtigluma subsp. patula]
MTKISVIVAIVVVFFLARGAAALGSAPVLQLHKRVSALSRAPHPAATPAYLHRDDFVRYPYLDGYAMRFAVRVSLGWDVHAAWFDADEGLWVVEATSAPGRPSGTRRGT